jgi:hypothetical protein
VKTNSIASHLNLKRYGNFTLTNAVRPGHTLPIVPEEAYRLESFRDPISRLRIPLLSASVTAEKVFDLYVDLLEPLGEVVHVVVESSHDRKEDSHEDVRRSHIDAPVLLSHLCEFEDLLINDGCTGIAAIAVGQLIEVQLDEHKQIYIYGRDLKPYRRIFRRYGIERKDELRLLSESEHLHHTTAHYMEEFKQLSYRLGAGDFDGILSDEGEFYSSDFN